MLMLWASFNVKTMASELTVSLLSQSSGFTLVEMLPPLYRTLVKLLPCATESTEQHSSNARTFLSDCMISPRKLVQISRAVIRRKSIYDKAQFRLGIPILGRM